MQFFISLPRSRLIISLRASRIWRRFVLVILLLFPLLFPLASHAFDPMAESEFIDAVNKLDYSAVARALARGTSPQNYNKAGRPALILIGLAKDYRLLDLLFQYHADANIADSQGNTALHWAVTTDDKVWLVYMLAHKIDVNKKNGLGQTALMTAARQGSRKLVESLLAAGADVSLRDQTGKSAIDFAKLANDTELANTIAAFAP